MKDEGGGLMEGIKPERLTELSDERKTLLLSRSMTDISEVYDYVRGIVQKVRDQGDPYILDNHRELKKNLSLTDLRVGKREIQEAYGKVDKSVQSALKTAARNIQCFHQAQREREMWSVEVRQGVLAGRLIRPISAAGVYIPGGQANYPSSALMNIIPAKVAGVKQVVACTPPRKGMKINPVTLVAMDMAGADRIFKVGGPWAVAGMAYGTGSIPKVDKIVGPGNKYVTAAKMAVFGVVDIDSPAGPSEALIIADETARADWLVWDFLSQIEHDADAGAVLVTPSLELAREVCRRINQELPGVKRKEMVSGALSRHSAVLISRDIQAAVDFSNAYAPEHLQIVTRDPWTILPQIQHAASIFLGPYAPVPAGDYASGTNHVLPTGGCARMFSGLSVDDFIKKPTFQYLSKNGLQGLKKTITVLAEEEGLPLHARTVTERFK
ncbi:MAG: histidinol dehydrogenase [Thermodesulfobacteriota bacterium]